MGIKAEIKKRLGSTGLFNYCRCCGEGLWFDEEKFDLGHNTQSMCLKCGPVGKFDGLESIRTIR